MTELERYKEALEAIARGTHPDYFSCAKCSHYDAPSDCGYRAPCHKFIAMCALEGVNDGEERD